MHRPPLAQSIRALRESLQILAVDARVIGERQALAVLLRLGAQVVWRVIEIAAIELLEQLAVATGLRLGTCSRKPIEPLVVVGRAEKSVLGLEQPGRRGERLAQHGIGHILGLVAHAKLIDELALIAARRHLRPHRHPPRKRQAIAGPAGQSQDVATHPRHRGDVPWRREFTSTQHALRAFGIVHNLGQRVDDCGFPRARHGRACDVGKMGAGGGEHEVVARRQQPAPGLLRPGLANRLGQTLEVFRALGGRDFLHDEVRAPAPLDGTGNLAVVGALALSHDLQALQ